MAKWAGRVGWIQRPEVRIPGHDFFDVELQVGDSEYVEYGVCVFRHEAYDVEIQCLRGSQHTYKNE